MLKETNLSQVLPIVPKIGNEWMLITAGDLQNHNTMTAAWGSVGYLWNKPVSTIFVRPQRYTYTFCEENDYYSLCFFDREYRKKLALCGSKSGREIDKDKACDLTPVFDLATYYEQASLVIICKKLYAADIKEDQFLDQEIVQKQYPEKDFHRMYVGEIVKVLTK